MTLTFSRLESLGRLGNQLWQLAATIAIGNRRGQRVVFRRWSYAPWFSIPAHHWVDELPADAVDVHTLPEFGMIAENHRPYMQHLELLDGHVDKIRDYFQPSARALDIIDAKWPGYRIDAPNMIGVHVRRGDALAVQKLYPVQSPEFFCDAVAGLPDAPVAVFSDDHSWCRATMSHLRDVRFMTGGADWEDLLCLSLCGAGHVIANSSFGWWGAFLSGDPAVRYPTPWYGPGFRDLDWRVMIPEGWVGVRDPKPGTQRR